MKLIDLLINTAHRTPERIACICPNERFTYQQLLDRVNNMAQQLRSDGYRTGTILATKMDNTPQSIISFFAASAVGASLYPLPPNETAHEHKRRLDLITPLHVDEELNDVALLVPTSGTTGPVKIAMLTDQALIANMTSYGQALKLQGVHRAYCTLPLHHIYPICAQLLTHISRGDRLVLHQGPFLSKTFFRVVQEEAITITALVPYLGQLLLEAPGALPRSLKIVTFSGSQTPPTLTQKLNQKYPGIRFVNMYGMTEAGSRISLGDKKAPAASVGKPLPTVQIKITDMKDSIGQIMVKSSGLMKGYYHQLDLTQETLRNGWLATGDLGTVDDEGYLYITGRCKNIINSGSNNIYPEEIEAILLAHPHVAQAVVVAQAHPRLQEVPYAFVVPDSPVRVAELIQFCRQHLSLYKTPHQIELVKKLPRLPNGKIDRQHLIRRSAHALDLLSPAL